MHSARCAVLFPLLVVAAGSANTMHAHAAQVATTTASAHYEATQQTFRLDGGNVTYAIGISRTGELQTVYWGARLAPGDPLPTAQPVGRAFEINDSPQEFGGWGGGLTAEPALKITFPDGNRDLVLHFVSSAPQPNGLTVVLKDIERDVFVTLHYEMDRETGILARWADIQNRTAAPLMVEQAESAEWNLPAATGYSLRYLSGRWGGEDQLQTRAIDPGETVLESRRGLTGHEFAPWFAIAQNADVNEREGQVWFGALAWSGSWRITIEQDEMQQLKIVGGYNPFDFGYKLDPGETLSTPKFYGGLAQHGFQEMSRLESTFQVHHILPQSPHPRLRPVLYNSWEATEFNFDEHTQEQLADKAASIGVERFVMDDGWFSTRTRDNSGLGDWYPNPQRFPHGLKPLIDHVHSLGMDFGLWVEPEMVNENSDLYRKHPEWILNFPGRPRTQARSQFVLNLALPQVQEYILGFLDKLLSENDIAFLKWDANRNFSEPGWPQVRPDEQKKVWVAYVQGYYHVLETLRQRFPKLEIESCSGGGGRIDLGVMHFTDEVWTSDNTDPFDRLLIQEGFTYAYTPQIMMAWVTDSPNWYNGRGTSLTYRFLSSMQGSLGVGANLDKWTSDDFATAKNLITEYKQIRALVQQGVLYRLVSPRDGSNVSSSESVSQDQNAAVVFAFLHSQQMRYPFPTLHPQGLRPDATYSIRALSGTLPKGTPARASGAFWMHEGIHLDLTGDFAAQAVVLHTEPQ
ncbi:MAG TPA: alpha-galactosidase [Bryocella sp.]|nr:alpha-galactosidase [Bryocella sp.]